MLVFRQILDALNLYRGQVRTIISCNQSKHRGRQLSGFLLVDMMRDDSVVTADPVN